MNEKQIASIRFLNLFGFNRGTSKCGGSYIGGWSYSCQNGMFKAGEAIKETIQKWIADSDVYLLILGGRYGSIDSNTEISYTQILYIIQIR